jgi:uncharacterized DUF497 family protein
MIEVGPCMARSEKPEEQAQARYQFWARSGRFRWSLCLDGKKKQFIRGEQRYATTGMIGTEFITVIHTYVQENDQESADIISARKATPTERRRYQVQKS